VAGGADVEDVVVLPGAAVFHQGEPSDYVYVVLAGTVDVLREQADGRGERLATVTQGQYVGELGPLLGIPRSATAQAGPRGATLRPLSPQQFRASAPEGWGAGPRPLRANTRRGASSARPRRSSALSGR
ncbi:MAG: cyclic nucleotide-binding domain-containing protein, partial [Acidimicrobiia bacterium]|nr:cyclic nucleotide-binding domain-containing protein [Acidimicrobiia bacterium]